MALKRIEQMFAFLSGYGIIITKQNRLHPCLRILQFFPLPSVFWLESVNDGPSISKSLNSSPMASPFYQAFFRLFSGFSHIFGNSDSYS